MRLTFTLLLFLNLNFAFAQPTATNAIIPGFQDSIHLVNCNPADELENAFGADQSWDFSGLTAAPEADYYFKFFDPVNTPFGANFPNSELAAINADSQYVYYVQNNGFLELVGAVFSEPGVGTAISEYSDNEAEEAFPVEYENSWTDNFAGTNSLGGFSAPFDGVVTGDVEGYGTLILPNATYTNVLRVKETRTLSIQGVPDMNSTMYRYISADYPLWLLSIEIFESGDPLIYYQDFPELLTSSSELQIISLSVYPNPVEAGTELQMNIKDAKIQRLELISVESKSIDLNYIQDETVIVPADVVPGIYILKGQSDESVFVNKIFIF